MKISKEHTSTIGIVLSSVPRYSETFFRNKIKGLQDNGYKVILFVDYLTANDDHFDCDVIQADGGTRTASITGAYVALKDAITHLLNNQKIAESPLTDSVAAISVGIYKGTPVLDLDYIEDSDCDTDMNIVMTGVGGFVEIQGTAEGEAFNRNAMHAMIDLATDGIAQISVLQKQALS